MTKQRDLLSGEHAYRENHREVLLRHRVVLFRKQQNIIKHLVSFLSRHPYQTNQRPCRTNQHPYQTDQHPCQTDHHPYQTDHHPYRTNHADVSLMANPYIRKQQESLLSDHACRTKNRDVVIRHLLTLENKGVLCCADNVSMESARRAGVC